LERIGHVLAKAQDRGFIGPGPIAAHIDHSLAFASQMPTAPRQAVDLGSGGGLPGLVMAVLWPDSHWVLLDASKRRTAFLSEAVSELELSDRVDVLCQRAEEAGRDPGLRGQADLVVARAFGPPAVTAECAAPLLRVDGSMVVAEPPGGASDRWPAGPLSLLGLVPDRAHHTPVAFQRMRQVKLCPGRYPRRTGIPAKRPLY
jgi:16S rRNA (guanine527-N7)-methyltransferase